MIGIQRPITVQYCHASDDVVMMVMVVEHQERSRTVSKYRSDSLSFLSDIHTTSTVLQSVQKGSLASSADIKNLATFFVNEAPKDVSGRNRPC